MGQFRNYGPLVVSAGHHAYKQLSEQIPIVNFLNSLKEAYTYKQNLEKFTGTKKEKYVNEHIPVQVVIFGNIIKSIFRTFFMVIGIFVSIVLFKGDNVSMALGIIGSILLPATTLAIICLQITLGNIMCKLK